MLPWVQYWYNASFHHTIHMSPYKALFGRDPPSVVSYVHHADDPPALQETLQTRDALLRLIKTNL